MYNVYATTQSIAINLNTRSEEISILSILLLWPKRSKQHGLKMSLKTMLSFNNRVKMTHHVSIFRNNTSTIISSWTSSNYWFLLHILFEKTKYKKHILYHETWDHNYGLRWNRYKNKKGNNKYLTLKGLWEIPLGLLRTHFSRSRFLHFCIFAITVIILMTM